MAAGGAPAEHPLPRAAPPAAKGLGKGPPPPPRATGARGAGAGEEARPCGAREPEAAGPAAGRPPLEVGARLMDGREITVELQPDSLVQSAQAQVASNLGIHWSRVRLVLGAAALDSFSTVEGSEVHAGASLLVVILPPVYATIEHMGISPPDRVLTLKADLHSELAAARAGPAA